MSGPEINTPRDRIFILSNGKAQLEFNTAFRPRWQKRYSQAQMFVDSEVLRLSEPFTPLKTGMLVKSGTLGTDVGSGEVAWIAPYAKRQYYLANRRPSQTGPLRGSYWFQRMKEVHGATILRGARKLAGQG